MRYLELCYIEEFSLTAGWHILVQSRNCVIATSHVIRLPSLMSAARQVGP